MLTVSGGTILSYGLKPNNIITTWQLVLQAELFPRTLFRLHSEAWMKAIFFAAHSLQNPESRVFLSLSFYYYYYDDFFFFFLHKRNQTIAKKNGFTLSHKATFPTAVRENCYSETVSGSLQKGGYLHSETELCTTFLSPGAEMRAGMEQFCPHPIHCVRFRNCKTPTTVRKKTTSTPFSDAAHPGIWFPSMWLITKIYHSFCPVLR